MDVGSRPTLLSLCIKITVCTFSPSDPLAPSRGGKLQEHHVQPRRSAMVGRRSRQPSAQAKQDTCTSEVAPHTLCPPPLHSNAGQPHLRCSERECLLMINRKRSSGSPCERRLEVMQQSYARVPTRYG